MAFKVLNVTIGATATPLVTAVAGHRTPWQEIQIDGAPAHDLFIGDSNVSSTNYAIKIAATTGSARIIGNGPAAIKIDDLENIYVSGTQNDVVHGYALTL